MKTKFVKELSRKSLLIPEWIECNLPWDSSGLPDMPDGPDLSDREREVFGTTDDEECDKVKPFQMKYLIAKLDIEYFLEDDSSFSWNSRSPEFNKEVDKKLKALNDPEIDQYIEYVNFEEKYNKWYVQQPETIKYREEWDETMNKQDTSSFMGQGLNKAGTLIETEKGQYLIGHINKLGGVCDDCTQFEPDTVIKRYKVVWND